MRIRALAAVVVAVFAVGCGSKPPPPAEPAPEPPPAPKAEAPPPPKCEALTENCKADPGTHARIAHSSFVFAPVKGWVYAQADTATIAQADAETGPAMVVVGYDADKDAKKELDQRDKAFIELSKQVSLALPKAKTNWKRPTCTCTATACAGSGGDLCKAVKPVNQLKTGVWQIDGVTRGGKKGSMLIIQAPLGDGKALLGVGFVTDEDTTGADQSILRAFESITMGPQAAPNPGPPSGGPSSPGAGGDSGDKPAKDPGKK